MQGRQARSRLVYEWIRRNSRAQKILADCVATKRKLASHRPVRYNNPPPEWTFISST